MAINGADTAPGTALLLAAAPEGKSRLMEAGSVIPSLAAVPPSAWTGTAAATVIELDNPADPQAVLTRVRAAAAAGGVLTVLLVGQLQLDRKQKAVHLALARTTPTTMRYTAIPWAWLVQELQQRRPDTTTLFVDLVADAEAWQQLLNEPLVLPVTARVYGVIAPPPGRRRTAEPRYTHHLAQILRTGYRPGPDQLHHEAARRSGADNALVLRPEHPATPATTAPLAAPRPTPAPFPAPAPVRSVAAAPVLPAPLPVPAPAPPAAAAPAAAVPRPAPAPAPPVLAAPAPVPAPPAPFRPEHTYAAPTSPAAQVRPPAAVAPHPARPTPPPATTVVTARVPNPTPPPAPRPPAGPPIHVPPAPLPALPPPPPHEQRTVSPVYVPSVAVVPVETDPHDQIAALSRAGRHQEAVALAAAAEQRAVQTLGAHTFAAVHWVEVRAHLAAAANDPAQSCALWLQAAQTRLDTLQQAPDTLDVEGAVDRAHHQWDQIRNAAHARSLAPQLVAQRRRVPGRQRAALDAIQKKLELLQAV